MKLEFQILLFNLFLCLTVSFALRQEEQLDEVKGRYKFGWEYDEGNESMIFDLRVKTTGFVGFGLNSIPGMEGADMLITGFNSDGTLYFKDYTGIGGARPTEDLTQDWTYLEGYERNSEVYIKFSRKLIPCDENDTQITNDLIYVIWSIGENDTIEYHGSSNRGSKQYNLLDPAGPPENVEKFDKWEIRVETNLTDAVTTYWCTIHKNTFANTSHVVGFRAVTESLLAKKHTHHFVVSQCFPEPGETDLFDKSIGPGYLCDSNDVDWRTIQGRCRTNMYVWAYGGKAFMLPEHVGYPVAEKETGLTEYIMVQIHYDNPDKTTGLKFETGFDIFYTEELRPNAGGLYVTGLDLQAIHFIPPQQDSFKFVGHCTSRCTSQLRPEGIKFFNVLLHSHLAGRKEKLRHFRDGTELPWISWDDNYDFNYQQNRPLKEEIIFLPGDQLAYECTYDTMDRDGVTLSGEGTMEEMCYSYIWYYPKVPNARFCGSIADPSLILGEFGIEKFDEGSDPRDPIITLPPGYANKTFSEVMNMQQWTPTLVAKYQKFIEEDIQYGDCDFAAPNASYPIVDKEYAPPVIECAEADPSYPYPPPYENDSNKVHSLHLSVFILVLAYIV